MNICFFEDEKIENFYPLCYFRPLSWLRVGAFSIQQKIENYLKPERVYHLTREYLVDYFDFSLPKEDEEILFINSRIIPAKENLDKINNCGKIIKTHDDFIGAFKGSYSEWKEILNNKKVTKENAEIFLQAFDYSWDLLYSNEELLNEDFSLYYKANIPSNLPDYFHMLKKENIYIDDTANIEPGAVLDGSQGAIIIDKNVTVMANSVIKGPVYLGEKTKISAGSKIYGHLSVGPVCKLGGEVEESIIQGYTNKKHDGFLGHAYLGEWCNLGADTNNSDLKNNYGKITMLHNGSPVKTEHRFLGLIMGDHSKSAINSSFNTGTIVGVNCNIFARGFIKRFIPSFSWVGDGFIKKYLFEKAEEVAKIVLERRDIPFAEKEEQLFSNVYKEVKRIERESS